MQGKRANQGWKMKMEPIHRVQRTGSHVDFMIPWRSCCLNLIIWGCVDSLLAVSSWELLEMQILGPHSYFGRICIAQALWGIGVTTQAGKAMVRLILWPGASVFNNLIFSKVGEQLLQETRNLLWALYSGLRTHNHHAFLHSLSHWGRFLTPPLAWLGPQAVTVIVLVLGFAFFFLDRSWILELYNFQITVRRKWQRKGITKWTVPFLQVLCMDIWHNI